MSTPVFFDTKISTQANGAQNFRVPVPLPKDPYEAIRQAYLDGTDTESETFEDPVETETHESPLTVAPPTSLPESTSSTLVPILCKTAQMVVRVPPVMSPGLSASMAEVAAMSESAFLEHDEDEDEDEDKEEDEEEDEEIEESLDSKSMSEDTKDEGSTTEDEDPAAWDESLAAGDEGPGMGVGSHGLDDESRGLDDKGHSVESDGFRLGEEEEAVPESQQQVVLVVGTAMSVPLGLGYGALRRQDLPLEKDYIDPEDGIVYIDVPAYPPPALPAQTPPSPEWSSGSLPISPSHSIIPLPISSPMIPLTIPSPVPTPTMAETEGFLTELGAQLEMDIGELFTRSGAVRDEIFSQRYRFRSLKHEQERVVRAALWHAISDTQGENQELQLQLAEERRARLELAEIVDSLERVVFPCVSALRLVTHDRADTHFLIRIGVRCDGYAYPVFVRLLDQMGTPTQYLCDYWSGWVRLPRCVKSKRQLSKFIQNKMGMSIRMKRLKDYVSRSVSLLEAAEAFKKANVEGEKKKSSEVITSKENTSKQKVSDEEPPTKKLKLLIPTSTIPLLIPSINPIPLKSFIQEHLLQPEVAKMMVKEFTNHLLKTTSSIYSTTPPKDLTPPREPTPPRDKSKGKGIATKDPLKEIIPFMEEGRSKHKMPNLRPFSTPDGQMTNEDVMAQAYKIAEYKAKRAKMIDEYNHQITHRADQLSNHKDQLESILPRKQLCGSPENKSKSNDILLQNLRAKFQWVLTQSKKLGVPPPTEVSTFENAIQRGTPEAEELFKKLKVTIEARDDTNQEEAASHLL
ncbi:hypothetical protein Tco_0910521 [Tanacetum coccineum]|uniref:Uncharacterized protein n=1 Tax=Tanacetum coccineum TaxID=301880 RepID=A0ABQ5CT38_9ASTR